MLQHSIAKFRATLLCPKDTGDASGWAFVVLPQEISALLPRRGRMTVMVSMNNHCFQVLLEPDGNKSHWLKISAEALNSAAAQLGQEAEFEIAELDQEPEPDIPSDFKEALQAAAAALATWEGTTTLARLDWIHWITSAKQAKTRTKRIHDACDMLASGKKRVCCFDSSGFYSKALRAPQSVELPS